jgi:hypothetical protein
MPSGRWWSKTPRNVVRRGPGIPGIWWNKPNWTWWSSMTMIVLW